MFPQAFLLNNSNPLSPYQCSLCSSTFPNWNFYYYFCTSKKTCHSNLLVVPAHSITLSLYHSITLIEFIDCEEAPHQSKNSCQCISKRLSSRAVHSSSLEDPVNRAQVHHFLQEFKNIEWRLNLNLSVRIFFKKIVPYLFTHLTVYYKNIYEASITWQTL